MSFRNEPQAGRQVDAWYRETSRVWRRRTLRVCLMVVPPMLAVILGIALLATGRWEFSLGVTVGCALTFLQIVLDSPPEWIERKRRGRDGERRTEKRLRRLEREGWTAAHDIARERGNFDHLLVGPGGAYLLETKALTGHAEVVQGRLTLRRGEDERDCWFPARPFDATVRAAAFEARKRLRAATGIFWVQGVIVLWSDFPQKEAELGRVFVVHGDHLVDWLRSRPQILEGDALERARRHLEDLQTYEIERERLGRAA